MSQYEYQVQVGDEWSKAYPAEVLRRAVCDGKLDSSALCSDDGGQTSFPLGMLLKFDTEHSRVPPAPTAEQQRRPEPPQMSPAEAMFERRGQDECGTA